MIKGKMEGGGEGRLQLTEVEEVVVVVVEGRKGKEEEGLESCLYTQWSGKAGNFGSELAGDPRQFAGLVDR
jgi:hypothetical protein